MGIIISERQLLLNFGLLKQDFKVNFLIRKSVDLMKERKKKEGRERGKEK